MDTLGEKTVDDHWRYQRDTFNLMAEKLVPYMVDVLETSSQTRELAEILKNWDLHDDIDAVGATVFHSIYERFAWLTFSDVLWEDQSKTILGVWYFWQERFQLMVLTDRLGAWFDDTTTTEIFIESRRS